MTENSSKIESIEKQIEALKAKKIEELKKQKALKAQELRKENAKRRKLESHLKILVGGYIFKQKNTKILTEILSTNLRDKDRDDLKKLISSFQAN